jgi:hypothetical protein
LAPGPRGVHVAKPVDQVDTHVLENVQSQILEICFAKGCTTKLKNARSLNAQVCTSKLPVILFYTVVFCFVRFSLHNYATNVANKQTSTGSHPHPLSHYLTFSCRVVDGQFSDWDDWSPCTSACGFAQKKRRRYCTNPAPQHGGADCVGRRKELQDCGNPQCEG